MYLCYMKIQNFKRSVFQFVIGLILCVIIQMYGLDRLGSD